MIIDKLESIWTAEEQETLAGFKQEQEKILQNGGNPVERFCDIGNAYIEIENSVRERYIDSFSDNPYSIFQDIQEIVDATEKQEFLEECQKWLETLDDIKEFDSDSPKFGTLLLQAKQSAAETYENCFNFILNRVLIQFDVIHHYQLDDKKMYEIIRKKVSEWYESPERKEEKKAISITVPAFNDKYMLMAYNKAAVAMATMDSKGLRTDIAGNMIIETKGVKMQIANFADVSAAFNISTSKLLIAGIIRFTQLNNIGDMRYNRTKTEILIPVEEYALLCGYDVKERPTNTQDEERKEKNRVKNLLKYVRKEIDKDLELLYNASVSFKTNNGDYADIRIITKKGITNRGKYIQMRFEEDFAKSLKVCRVSMFPVNLFKVKNPVAYRIGVAMSNHYNNDNNLIAGTADRMKIETLLEYSGLPTLGDIRRLKGSWRQKIQKPFEDALEILHHENMLDNYSYVKTGGIEISELNVDSDYYKIDADYQFPDFETWAGFLVKFKLHEAIDHTERIEQKQAEKEKSQSQAYKKKKLGRPKKKTDSNTSTAPKRKRGRPKKTES